MYSIIIPFSQSYDNIWFIYKIPDNLKDILNIWMIVKIPFWKKEIYWLVSKIIQNTDFNKSKIKEINSIYSEDIFLFDYQIKLLHWIWEYYFSLSHNSLSIFLPQNLVWKIIKNKFKLDKNLKKINYNYKNKNILTQNQKQVFDEIINSKENKFLLYWITWSWKTQIYIDLIKYYIDQNKQILLLVPEIILTNQIADRIKWVFGNEVIVLNSTVSQAKKTTYRELIYNSQAKIIIWTRSSLFYPYKDLWIIIIDEEHDNSYLSDNTPRYDSIEVINKISDLTNCKILLWSGTPKINHLYEWLKWKYKILNLFNEYS